MKKMFAAVMLSLFPPRTSRLYLQRTLSSVMCFAILVSFVTGATSYAALYEPPAYWAKTYGGEESDEPSSVLQTADGGFVLGGWTWSFGVGRSDAWIVKLNSKGGIQWEKAFGGDFEDDLTSLQQTTDGGYIVSGYTGLYSPDTNADFWVLKLDSAGNIEWEYAYGGDSVDLAFDVQQTLDGGYITGGVARSFGDPVGNLLVIKLHSDGSIEWQKEYGLEGNTERRVESIHQLEEGGYILTSTISGELFPQGAIWILRLDESGSIEWQKVYADESATLDTEGIEPTNDGGYVVLGEYGANNDFLVLKLNETGDISWQYTYGGEGDTDPESIQQTRDGGYVLGGSTSSFGVGDQDGWVIKLDGDGTIEWEKIYGGSGEDRINDVKQVSDGGYVTVGKTFSFGAGNKDFWVLKLNEEGNLGCCLAGFRVTDSEATVTPTSVGSVDTLDDIPLSSLYQSVAVTRTETDPTITDTEAVQRKQCYFRIYLRDGIAECLSIAPWLRTSVYVLLGLGVAALGFFLYKAIRKRPR